MVSCCCFLRYILLTVYIIDRVRSTNVINTTINCISEQDCFISCSSSFECQYSIINCPQNNECIVSCNNINSCKGLTINAQSASTLDIAGCSEDQSCINMTIYCPQNTANDQKNCLIEGNDNLNGINIYAVNGWNDIDIDYNTTSYNNNIEGKLYCSKDTPYDTVCVIGRDNNNWSCIENNNYCNNLETVTIGNNNNNNNNEWKKEQLDTEMTIIIVTMIASMCFITACCWYTIKRNKSKYHGMESNMNNNNNNNNGGDDNNYYNNNNNNNHHISSTNRIHQTFTTHSIKTTTDIIPKPISVTSISAQSTVPTMSMEIATDVDIGSNGSAEPEPQSNHNQNEEKQFEEEKEEKQEKQEQKEQFEEEQKEEFEDESMAEHNRLNVINENNENMSDLNVESFAATVEQKMDLKANISESESTFIKSPDTWDNFEKDNGILGDKYMMNQMMGYLEEGAICCSLE